MLGSKIRMFARGRQMVSVPPASSRTAPSRLIARAGPDMNDPATKAAMQEAMKDPNVSALYCCPALSWWLPGVPHPKLGCMSPWMLGGQCTHSYPSCLAALIYDSHHSVGGHTSVFCFHDSYMSTMQVSAKNKVVQPQTVAFFPDRRF